MRLSTGTVGSIFRLQESVEEVSNDCIMIARDVIK
jgi:hypothetical protein